MDKFFYRLIVQPIVKGLITAFLSLFLAMLTYTLFVCILQPVTPTFDYWFQAVALVLITVVLCFMIISVRDDFTTLDVTTYTVGKFWSKRAYDGKKVRWITMELMMLPLFVASVVFGVLFYRNHADVLLTYEQYYASVTIDVDLAMDYCIENMLLHFWKLFACIFLFWQWRHVRCFAKKGRCPYCKAAFSVGTHGPMQTEQKNSTKITKKGKNVVVGGQYKVTLDGDREVDRTRIGDVYETRYDYYRTDTQTTYYTHACTCRFCGKSFTKTDVSSSYQTSKIN